MSVEISRQGLEFFWAAVTGAGLGLIYDIGRALRREKAGLTIPVDLLFALIFFLTLLLTAVYTRGLRLYQCMGIFLGAGAYFLTVSPLWVLLWRRVFRVIGRLRRKFQWMAKKSVSFFLKNAKKVFPSGRKWGTINDIPHSPKRLRRRETQR